MMLKAEDIYSSKEIELSDSFRHADLVFLGRNTQTDSPPPGDFLGGMEIYNTILDVSDLIKGDSNLSIAISYAVLPPRGRALYPGDEALIFATHINQPNTMISGEVIHFRAFAAVRPSTRIMDYVQSL